MNGAIPISLAMGLYLWAAYTYWDTSRLGMMLTFLGYSLANVGLIVDIYEMQK